MGFFGFGKKNKEKNLPDSISGRFYVSDGSIVDMRLLHINILCHGFTVFTLPRQNVFAAEAAK